MADPTLAEGIMETEDTREAPWTVTEFFLDPRRYNPSAAILHKEANVRLELLSQYIQQQSTLEVTEYGGVVGRAA